MTGEQVRWGIENLNIDEKRLKEARRRGLDAAAQGLLHGPRGRRRGEVSAVGWPKWNVITDWIFGPDDRAADDRSFRRAVRQGKEHHPRDCSRRSNRVE